MDEASSTNVRHSHETIAVLMSVSVVRHSPLEVAIENLKAIEDVTKSRKTTTIANRQLILNVEAIAVRHVFGKQDKKRKMGRWRPRSWKGS